MCIPVRQHYLRFPAISHRRRAQEEDEDHEAAVVVVVVVAAAVVVVVAVAVVVVVVVVILRVFCISFLTLTKVRGTEVQSLCYCT